MAASAEPPLGGVVGAELAARLALRQDAAARRWSVVALSATTSTNDFARALAAGGAPEGTIVVADQQTSGRGRLGRGWHSPAGGGLWCSVLLRPRVPLSLIGPLPLVVALAACRAAWRLGARHVQVKWPNDLVHDGRKLGGILLETAAGPGDEPPAFVICGIGVNVRRPDDGFPTGLASLAVALDELVVGPAPTAGEFGEALLDGLAAVYDRWQEEGFMGLREEWLAANVTTGHDVAVSGAQHLDGHAVTVDGQGRLVVVPPSGEPVAVAAGDVTLRRPARTDLPTDGQPNRR